MLTIQDYKAGNPQTQTFTYDGLDRLISGQASGGSGGTYTLQNYTYSSSTGNLSTRAGVSYTYGDSNHKHAVTAMGSDTYSYDANGNQVTRNVGGSSYDLDYDAENRLVEISGAAEENYVYDGDGNRVKSTGSTMNLAAGILPTGDVTINRAAVITDNDSLADNSTQYAYAATAGLHYVKIDLGAVYSVNKIKVWHYVNDGRTYHSTKTQVSANGTSWVTVYDSAVSGEYPETPQGKEITFTTQDVRYIRDYVNGNSVNTGDHWTEIEVWGYGTVSYVGNYFEWKGSTGTMVKYYYAGSNRVAMRRGTSSLYWLLGDHLGSQSITADATGGKISETRYYPWGGDRFYEYTSSTNYRFTGQRKEFGSGLYFYGARWYDSAAGRFIQADSVVPSQNQGSEDSKRIQILLVVDYHEPNLLAQLGKMYRDELLKGDIVGEQIEGKDRTSANPKNADLLEAFKSEDTYATNTYNRGPESINELSNIGKQQATNNQNNKDQRSSGLMQVDMTPTRLNSMSLDRFAYSSNCPTSYTDPSGHSTCDYKNLILGVVFDAQGLLIAGTGLATIMVVLAEIASPISFLGILEAPVAISWGVGNILIGAGLAFKGGELIYNSGCIPGTS